MIEHQLTGAKMVAMQLTTDEGAFICNIDESDMTKMAAGSRARSSLSIMSFGWMQCSGSNTRSIGRRW